MEYTDSQKAEFMGSYAARRTRQMVMVLILIVLIIPLAIAGDRAKGSSPVLLFPILAAVGFSLWNWRCPACRGYLGRTFNPKFCQKCGVQLHE